MMKSAIYTGVNKFGVDKNFLGCILFNNMRTYNVLTTYIYLYYNILS